MSRTRWTRSPIIAVALAPVFVACSSSTDPAAPKALTSQEAATVADVLVSQVFGALDGGAALDRSGTSFSRSAAQLARGARPAGVAALSTTFNASCPLGGNITGTTSQSGALDTTGSGTIAVLVTYTPNACVVSTGTRHVTVNGAPSLAMSVSVPFVAFVESGVVSVQTTGGFSWEGGNCPVNYAATYNTAGHGTVSGSVCGQSVADSF